MVQVLQSRFRKLSSIQPLKWLLGRHTSEEYNCFFQYTSGRWIYNDREQKIIRYASFNVDALKRIATTVAGANCCVQVDKIAEGSFNKIFLLTFDNDTKLIAKIPCPLVAPRRLCTASEVATMDYARTVLGLPVPHVLSWSADADTEVGIEYILMEHIRGTELRNRMSKFGQDGAHFIEQLLDVECKFTQYRFSQIGSLYYKEDVSPELQQRPLYAEGVEGGGSDRFRIGPYVQWDIWRGDRNQLDVNHGPWPGVSSFINAIVDIEKQWLSRFAVPRESEDPFCRPDNENVPDAHIRLLDDFLAVIMDILPPDELCAPVLWHTDLHASNIFVAPEGSPDIVGLIDWQGMSVRPLFLQATFAACVRYRGDSRITVLPGLVAPTHPPDLQTYSKREREYLKGQQRLAAFHKYYEIRVRQTNPLSFASQVYPNIEHIIPSILSASRTWYEGMHSMRRVLLGLQDAWESIAPGRFPVKWDEDEIARHQEASHRLKKYRENIARVDDVLQLEGDGWVTNERYEKVMRYNRRIMKAWDPEKMGGPYPFQDGGWSWFLS